MIRLQARTRVRATVVAVALTTTAWLAAPVAAQQTHILVLTGLSGEPAYAEQFHEWATTLIDAAIERYEVPPEQVAYLAEKVELDPERIDGRSTKENVEQVFADIAERAEPNDHVLVLLIGHGSHNSGESRFNLPGRDLTAGDYAVLLSRLNTQRVTFVNAATSSGGFIEALSGEGRTVMTATRSSGQWNETVFGGHFVAAFADGEEDSDQNKDGRVSMLEAFEYAVVQVARVYESDGRLQTEHALLDDNGDGEGTREPDPLTTDGAMARSLFITTGDGSGLAGLSDDPVIRALYEERLLLQEQIEGLRATRGGTDPASYDAELEKLLVAMALKTREIRTVEGDAAEPR
ncbi:MAG: hypothetical protein VX427_02375 [Acidobacteriota bacterium]|nr:hypothetical protein [Acidobacteriota bacterium]